MSDEQIQWTGLTPDEIAARMQAHPFADVREPLMGKITLTALAHSQPLTPVRTGTLRRSETNRVEPGGLKGYIGSAIKYAPFVHEGTRYMTARPFFEQGIAAAAGDIAKLLEKAGDEYFSQLVR